MATAEGVVLDGRLRTPSRKAQGLESYVVFILLFVVYSRVFDVFASDLHIAAIAFSAALLVTVLSGQFLWVLRPGVSKLWLLFTVWLGLSTVFSIWRGGSTLAMESWLKALAVYIVTVSLLTSFDACFRAVRTVAWAIGALVLLSFFNGNADSGRYFLDQGKLQNPNELAQMLLIWLPCLWLIFSRAPRASVRRLVVAGLTAGLIILFVRSGSRGAMVAAVVTGVVMLARASSKLKAVAVLSAVLVPAVLALAVSEPLRTRYLTFFEPDVEEGASTQTTQMAQIAGASAETRRELFEQSVIFTMRNPILGLGPGMFAEARERAAAALRKHAVFLQTHNTYTQLSSEGGIPAAVLFIIIIVSCFRKVRRIQRLTAKLPGRRMQDMAAVAGALGLSILAYGVSSLFLNSAYNSLLPTLAGLAVALGRAVDGELGVDEPSRAPAQRSQAVTSPFSAKSPFLTSGPLTAAGPPPRQPAPVTPRGSRMRSRYRV